MTRMLSQRRIFSGRVETLVCDGRCDKAWGINGRPRLYYFGDTPRALEPGEEPPDHDDCVFVADSALGVAPGPGETVGVAEGSDLKPSAVPLRDPKEMNKWCARECERSDRFREGEVVKVRSFEPPEPNRQGRSR